MGNTRTRNEIANPCIAEAVEKPIQAPNLYSNPQRWWTRSCCKIPFEIPKIIVY